MIINLRQLILASIAVGSVMLTPVFSYVPFATIVHAELIAEADQELMVNLKLDEVYGNKNLSKEAKISFYNDIINRYPNNTKALYLRGCLYLDMYFYDKALVDFNKAVELGLDTTINYKLYEYRGYSYYKLKEYNKAMSDYNRLLEFNDDDYRKSYQYELRGYVHERLGEYDEAITDYNKALQLFENEKFYADLSYVYEKMGDKKMAKKYLKKSSNWSFDYKNYREKGDSVLYQHYNSIYYTW